MLPKQIQNFIENFSKLPSIGPRMARRLAFYFMDLDEQTFESISSSMKELENINRCSRCFFIKSKDDELCRICSNPKRDKDVIAVVEKETDVISLEKAGEFEGVYLVMGPSSGTGSLQSSQKLRLKTLKKLIEKEMDEEAKEIIIATSPNTHGDFLANIVKREFKDLSKKITRLGRGLPTGGEIEFADKETLSKALERRSS